MKKLSGIIVLLAIVFTANTQTFTWKELASLNELSSAEKATWLEDEKSFVLTGSIGDMLIYEDTTSSLDEQLAVSDSIVIYTWEYTFNKDISETKATDYLMRRSLGSISKLELIQDKDDSGNVVSDALAKIKGGQLMATGNIYNEDGSKTNYSSVEILE